MKDLYDIAMACVGIVCVILATTVGVALAVVLFRWITGL